MNLTRQCHHVYLDVHARDDRVIVKLCQCLEKLGIKCHLNEGSFNFKVQCGFLDDSEVSRYAKILIYVTDDYIENIESVDKGSTTSRLFQFKDFPEDAVIVLRSRKLTKCIPLDLSGFVTFDVSEEIIEKDSFLLRLERALHRESSATCSGRYAALSYFFGFLRFVLPDFQQRLLKQTLTSDGKTAEKTVKKLLIIMPESCLCPPKFPTEKFKHTDKFVVRMAARAGNEKRDYKSSLYQVHDDAENVDYYFVGEFATPLLTMYEACEDGWISRDDLEKQRDAFAVALNEILSDPRNANCNQQYVLLRWPSNPASGSNTKVELFDYLLPVIKQELANEVTLEEDEHRPVETCSLAENKIPTVEFLDVTSSNPAAVYDSMLLEKYDLDVEIGKVRGVCLIINEETEQRIGSDKDVERVKELFESLKFECVVHKDLTLVELKEVLTDVSGCVRSSDKAFILVFMSHGHLGAVYTNDCKAVAILDIANFFNDVHCPSLRGKPKMFFIQACARARPQQTVTNDGETTAPTSGAVFAANLNFSRQFSVPVMVTDADDTSCSAEVLSAEIGPGQAANERDTHPAGETVVDRDAAKTASEGGPPDSCVSSPAAEEAASPYTPDLEDETDRLLQRDANVPPTLREVDEESNGASHLVPSNPDYLMSYATLPGAAAYRVDGALYIKYLCEHLTKRIEIDRALKLVTKSVSEELPMHVPDDQQIPFHFQTAQKLIFL